MTSSEYLIKEARKALAKGRRPRREAGVSILGFAAHLPERRVDNDELASLLDLDPQWIFRACGIQERRYAAATETVVDLAEQAARKSLEASGVRASELGAIIVGTGTPQRVFPGVSASLQQRLGNTRAFAFDIHLSSIGGLAALGVGCDLCPRLGPIRLVGAEKMSLCVGDHPCKETTILFGDGAGAGFSHGSALLQR